jgi:hypothetical protein
MNGWFAAGAFDAEGSGLGDAMSLQRQDRAIDLFIVCQPSEFLI